MITSETTIEGQSAAVEKLDLTGYLAVLLAAACWGTSGVFVKSVVADSGVTALALAFWRDLATFLTLFISLRLLRPAWLRVDRADLPWIVGMGASLGALHVVWNLGVLINGAAVATVQQAAVPAIVAVVAWLIWRESLGWEKIAAIVLTFIGTFFVSGLGVSGQARFSAIGLLIGLGIPLTYSSWTLFGKRVRQGYNPLTTLTYGFGFGALTLLPLQFFTVQPWPVRASSLLWLAGLVAVPTLAGFSFYIFALGRLPASVATILAMSEIVFATTYAYILLGERLTPGQIIGALLVVSGVALLYWNGKQKGTHPKFLETSP